jgi:hypothetical protein
MLSSNEYSLLLHLNISPLFLSYMRHALNLNMWNVSSLYIDLGKMKLIYMRETILEYFFDSKMTDLWISDLGSSMDKLDNLNRIEH